MVLTFYDGGGDVTRQLTGEERDRFDRISETVRTELRSSSLSSADAASRQKFVDCHIHVSRHHSKIVSHFANGFIYNMKQAQLVNEQLDWSCLWNLIDEQRQRGCDYCRND